jgi:DNA-binding Lrp family transcriptional regulator
MVHIGSKIKKVVYESRIPINEFASSINKSRTVVYNIFQRETIDTGLLMRISKALNHNFFTYYLTAKNVLNEGQEKYYSKAQFNELSADLEECKKENEASRKEIEYLKKINKLLEGKKS